MLAITKATSNTMVVTVTEKVTIANPYYLFVFTHPISNEQRAFILSDVSTHTERYNEFTLTEGSSAQKTLKIGRHYYTIYAQTSSSNIDPDLADEEVERGIAEVTGTANTIATNTITQTHKVNVITQ
jgi:hypothetical protein